MNSISCEGCARLISGKVRRGRCESCYRKLIKQLKQSGSFEAISPSKAHPAYQPRNGPAPRTLSDKRRAAAARALSSVTPGWGGCWIFTGRTREGYAQVKVNGSRRAAHRLVYEAAVGPIPEGFHLDHICHSVAVHTCPGGNDCPHRRCINPAHLEPVTPGENQRRGVRSQKTHCIRGHEFDAKNTLRRPQDNGSVWRICRACHRDERRRRRAQQKTTN